MYRLEGWAARQNFITWEGFSQDSSDPNPTNPGILETCEFKRYKKLYLDVSENGGTQLAHGFPTKNDHFGV